MKEGETQVKANSVHSNKDRECPKCGDTNYKRIADGAVECATCRNIRNR